MHGALASTPESAKKRASCFRASPTMNVLRRTTSIFTAARQVLTTIAHGLSTLDHFCVPSVTNTAAQLLSRIRASQEIGFGPLCDGILSMVSFKIMDNQTWSHQQLWKLRCSSGRSYYTSILHITNLQDKLVARSRLRQSVCHFHYTAKYRLDRCSRE